MTFYILVDEETIEEFIQNSIFQSIEFDQGLRLAKTINGEREIEQISPRVFPVWIKETVYLVRSKKEGGYVLINSDVLSTEGFDSLDNRLNFFQKICRFCLKSWRHLKFSAYETWSSNGCGVVFPFSISRQIQYRIGFSRDIHDERIQKRYGSNLIFAFRGGKDENLNLTEEDTRAFKKSFESLNDAFKNLPISSDNLPKEGLDTKYTPIFKISLNGDEKIPFQNFSQWLPKLTHNQKSFVESPIEGPQRVEGPAGTGKTLSLILKAHQVCLQAEAKNEEKRILFLAHSEATKQSVEYAFSALCEKPFNLRDRSYDLQTIELYTLQSWCGEFLGEKEIPKSQFLDKDALQAKEMRKLLIEEIVGNLKKEENKAFEFLSEGFKSFFTQENNSFIAELLQHEIGIMIKGRANENEDAYINLPYLSFALPVKIVNDRRFVFGIYKKYQSIIRESGVFDSDDIVLTALGRLNTPIWRRRRITEGYDSLFVDETHLFNLNELSIFHHLLKDSSALPIAFTLDVSQAPGERGLTASLIREVMTGSQGIKDSETKTTVIFRSSPKIIDLAESITAAGATLFTSFENPLVGISSAITQKEEDLSSTPVLWQCENDERMCKSVLNRAKSIANEIKCNKGNILIVGMVPDLILKLKETFANTEQPFVELLQRGDLDTVIRGVKENAFVLSHPDFVGGLEFKAVLIVGLDDGRVPPTESSNQIESRHFLDFKSCNRLYVVITRARFRVEMFYTTLREKCKLLEHALRRETLEEKKEEIPKEIKC